MKYSNLRSDLQRVESTTCASSLLGSTRWHRNFLISGVLAVSLSLAFIASPIRADQNDPSLAQIFNELQQSDDTQTGRTLTNQVWQLWHEHDDTVVNETMALGVTQMRVRNYRAALKTFDHLVKIAPDFAEGWNKRATVLFLLGDYAASSRDVDKTLDLEPRHFGALAGQGYIYLRSNDESAALASFYRALQINPFLIDVKQLVERLEGEKVSI